MDGSATIGTVALASGAVTLSTSALSAGTRTITAVYSGEISFAGSRSAGLSRVVQWAATTTTVASSLNPAQPPNFTGIMACRQASYVLVALTVLPLVWFGVYPAPLLINMLKATLPM